MIQEIQPGDMLVATDARGDEHEVQAVTGVWTSEFPDRTTGRLKWRPGLVVTVRFTTKDSGQTWPLYALRPVTGTEAGRDA